MVAGLKKFKLIGWLLYGPCKVNGERHKDPASDSDLKWVEFFSWDAASVSVQHLCTQPSYPSSVSAVQATVAYKNKKYFETPTNSFLTGGDTTLVYNAIPSP